MIKTIANCFNVHKLTNNLKKNKKKTFKRNSKTPLNNNFKEIFYSNFSEEELKEAIRNTKVKKKQPGPDNIFLEFIHNLGPKAIKILTTIYNKVWSSRDNLPDERKKSHQCAHTETRQTS